MIWYEEIRVRVLLVLLLNQRVAKSAIVDTNTMPSLNANNSSGRTSVSKKSTDSGLFTEPFIMTDVNTCGFNFGKEQDSNSSEEDQDVTPYLTVDQKPTNITTIECAVTTAATQFTEAVSPEKRLDYVGYVFVPLLMILGIVGNVLTVRVMLTSRFRHLPVSLVLVALAISDTLVNLLFPFNKPFVRRLLGGDVRALSSGGCKLFFWAYRYAKTTSSWMVVLISLERFIAVWFYTRAKVFNTKRNAVIAIAVVYTVFAGYIGYWCSWADQIIGGSCIPNTRPPGLERRAQLFLVLGLSFYAFIPSAILVFFNFLIVYKLLKVRMNTKNKVAPSTDGPKKQDLGYKTTTMLSGIAIAFVVLVTPVSCAHIVSFAKGVNIFETKEQGMVAFREITQLMEQMNNSINFFLYVICSKRFRSQLLKLVEVSCLVRRRNHDNETTATQSVRTVPTEVPCQSSAV